MHMTPQVQVGLPDDLAEQVQTEQRPAPAGRPWVVLNMIASVDGIAAVNERSGGLGAPPDRKLFRALRAMTDVILVGAATVRAERYGPVVLDDQLRSMRRDSGRPEHPRLAVVTRSGSLDADLPLFDDADHRPIVYMSSPVEQASEGLQTRAEVVELGADDTLADALADLASRGARTVLCEGGPRVNAQLFSAGLVDELCVSIAPWVVGGDATRILAGPALPEPVALSLARIYIEDDLLLARYLVQR